MQLNKEQKVATESIYGQVLVVSCPGSGKTTVIIQRIKNMLDAGILASKMLNITFTKAAALEMEERFSNLYGDCGVSFSTIHAFCYHVLCKEYHFTANNILKESEKWLFLANRLQHKIPPAEMEETIKKIIGEFSYVKNSEKDYRTYYPESCDASLFVSLYSDYEEYKKTLQKVDFEDILTQCRNIFKTCPDVLQRWQEKYSFITVDEYQDTNSIQADIFYLLAGEKGNIFVVGDDDQAIYGFRSADSSIMMNFPAKYPKCKTIYMASNYRSGKDIVKVAGNLIKNNAKRFPKKFLAFREEKGEIILIKAQDSTEQAGVIRKMIQNLNQSGEDYKDMAILFRTNTENMEPVAEFIKHQIPFYTTEKPHSMYEEFIYDDIMAYYRLSHKQEKRGDLQKILNHPSRYLKAEYFRTISFDEQNLLSAAKKMYNKEDAMITIFRLVSNMKQLGKEEHPKEFIEFLSKEVGYRKWLSEFARYRGKKPEDYLKIFDALLKEASNFSTMEEWVAYVKFYESELEKKKKNKNKDGICLSTFHSAKGLEWKHVFIIDINEDKVPYYKAETVLAMEEERRMFYVAVTRAKDNLYLSYLSGKKNELLYSPFLDEMGLEIKTLQTLSGDTTKKLGPNGLAR